MRKDDHEAGQMSLDFTLPVGEREMTDRRPPKRPLLRVIVSDSGRDVPSCSLGQQKARETVEPDIYSTEVTRALHAFADRLRW
ncbi:hypothetical protein J2803_000150 [Paraburkholderia phenoliruptrix]|nr:hypothetical protein [Paraburkholderia phenoliruptrix]